MAEIFSPKRSNTNTSKVRQVVDGFFTTLQIEGGPRFRGHVAQTADTTRVSNFNMARRLLRVQPNSPVSPGAIVLTPDDHVYLAADHGSSYLMGTLFTEFKLFEMSLSGTWIHHTTTVDPVTSLEKAGAPQDNGTIRYTLEPAGSTSDKIKVPEAEYDLITNATLELGDRVDGYEVLRSDKLLGVTIAEVRK